MDNEVPSAVSARVSSIAAGLDAIYSKAQLDAAPSRRSVHRLVADVVAVYGAALKELQARVAELEAGGVSYKGAYQRALSYRKGSVVTSGGSMWTALSDVPEGVSPGSDPASWQLSQKGRKRVPAGRKVTA